MDHGAKLGHKAFPEIPEPPVPLQPPVWSELAP
jgi:hypothetical protein